MMGDDQSMPMVCKQQQKEIRSTGVHIRIALHAGNGTHVQCRLHPVSGIPCTGPEDIGRNRATSGKRCLSFSPRQPSYRQSKIVSDPEKNLPLPNSTR